jgi:predicted nucleic acid-binding protein
MIVVGLLLAPLFIWYFVLNNVAVYRSISVVTLIELAQGAARADTAQRKEKRHPFIHELLTALPIHPVTVMVALRVGEIDGEHEAKGVRLPLADLLIGATALELGYSVATGQSPPLPDDPWLVGREVLVAEICNHFAIT